MNAPAPVQLWVEGPGDRALLDAVLRAHGGTTTHVVYKLGSDDRRGGVDKLAPLVRVAVKSHPVVGVVIDADRPEDGRWSKLREALRLGAPFKPRHERAIARVQSCARVR